MKEAKIMSDEKITVGSENIFADMGYSDAGSHQLKARIVSEIQDIVDNRKLKQKAAGEIMNISQPEVSRLLRGHFREYSVERLMEFLTLFNRDVEIVVKRRDEGVGHLTFVGTAIATA